MSVTPSVAVIIRCPVTTKSNHRVLASDQKSNHKILIRACLSNIISSLLFHSLRVFFYSVLLATMFNSELDTGEKLVPSWTHCWHGGVWFCLKAYSAVEACCRMLFLRVKSSKSMRQDSTCRIIIEANAGSVLFLLNANLLIGLVFELFELSP